MNEQITAIKSEQEDAFRLRKAQEFLAHCRTVEDEARRALREAIEATARAKSKHEALFVECESRAVARRKSGQITVTSGY